MSFYRNTGAPFVRNTGEWVNRDQVFEPTEAEVRQYGYKLVEEAAPEPERKLPAGWPLTMKPALYLRLNPKGKHADLAREILAEEMHADYETTARTGEQP